MKVALDHINFKRGWPTPRIIPAQALNAAAAKVFGQEGIENDLEYGPGHGIQPLRENIANWLSQAYIPAAGKINEDRILVTNGASNGLAMLLQKIADPVFTRAVWLIEPTYFLACPIFRDAGMGGRIRGVPETEDGVDLEFLAKALSEVDRDGHFETPAPKKTPELNYPKIYRHIIYLIPTFSNPSGKTMELRSREALVRLARKHDALVISDDVYDFLKWPALERDRNKDVGACPPRLVDVDHNLDGCLPYGNCVSNGSFSKIVAPGVRVGWLEGSTKLMSVMGTVGATASGGCQSHMASLLINELLANGTIQDHIEKVLIPTYKARYYSLMGAIEKYLVPLGVTVGSGTDYDSRGMAGGFFTYISFEKCGINTDIIAPIALHAYNLQIAPGHIFAVPDDPSSKERTIKSYGKGARLCWAWHEEEKLVEGILRLATVIKSLKTI
ncbi:aminotransferase [Penicillium taxi]|uniref:aminotransferase n=1 Tax=Penicillium taxi TaxID=168475 RepID=UPI00254511AA|nr:aminotransferase [Penicillium taxi]KAJ5887947.1 aminotransferase [Penicillium taxi]